MLNFHSLIGESIFLFHALTCHFVFCVCALTNVLNITFNVISWRGCSKQFNLFCFDSVPQVSVSNLFTDISFLNFSVAAALHNLGQFHIVQRKFEEAQVCYEVVMMLDTNYTLFSEFFFLLVMKNGIMDLLDS